MPRAPVLRAPADAIVRVDACDRLRRRSPPSQAASLAVTDRRHPRPEGGRLSSGRSGRACRPSPSAIGSSSVRGLAHGDALPVGSTAGRCLGRWLDPRQRDRRHWASARVRVPFADVHLPRPRRRTSRTELRMMAERPPAGAEVRVLEQAGCSLGDVVVVWGGPHRPLRHHGYPRSWPCCHQWPSTWSQARSLNGARCSGADVDR